MKKIFLTIFALGFFATFHIGFAQAASLDFKINGSYGPITVPYYSKVLFSWVSGVPESTCTGNYPELVNTPAVGEKLSAPVTNGPYGFIIRCGNNSEDSALVTVNVEPNRYKVDIKANGSDGPITVPYWSDVTLSWTSENPDIPCADDSGYDGSISSGSGQKSTGPLKSPSTTYRITCGGVKDSVTVNVSPDLKPIKVDLKANGSDGSIILPYDVGLGRNVDLLLSWTSNYPDLKCGASNNSNPWSGLKPASGEVTLNPTTLNVSLSELYTYWSRIQGIYSLNCTGRGETATDFVEVRAASPPPKVYSVDLKFKGGDGPYTVQYGEDHLLSWTASGYLDGRCTAGGSWRGYKSFQGQEFTGSIQSNKVYKITCDAQQGGHKQEDTVTIYVTDKVTTPTPTPTPTPVPTPTPIPTPKPTLTCDSTAKAIVTAAGGCSNVDQTEYKNVYGACCTVVTKTTLLQILNDALADGVIDATEKKSLLSALNSYLSK